MHMPTPFWPLYFLRPNCRVSRRKSPNQQRRSQAKDRSLHSCWEWSKTPGKTPVIQKWFKTASTPQPGQPARRVCRFWNNVDLFPENSDDSSGTRPNLFWSKTSSPQSGSLGMESKDSTQSRGKPLFPGRDSGLIPANLRASKRHRSSFADSIELQIRKGGQYRHKKGGPDMC